jgi:two-component system sensor histidine kinase UhpB
MTSAVLDLQADAIETRLVSTILRVPLLGKLLGANALIVVGAILTHVVLPASSTAIQLGVMLVLSFAVTAVLVWLALRPIVQLEATATKVSEGDFSARVPDSALADRQIVQLSRTMNRLLERVETDRARIHYLAGRSVRARDLERQFVARELRDSLAQTIAAATMQVAAARRNSTDSLVNEQLYKTTLLLQELTEEMRSVAETLYPGTLGEFGLLNAIDALVRRVSRRSAVRTEVDAGMFNAVLPAATLSALYRVADEALRNVEQHAHASNVRVALRSNGHVTLEIDDDGCGIDMRSSDPLQAGLGLFSAKAVLALAGGELQISSAPGLGTRVSARVPVDHK